MDKACCRILTRNSPLAMRQAELVSSALELVAPEWRFELIGQMTEGDRSALSGRGILENKGWFVKELEQGLLMSQGDVAVHSAKDLSAVGPDRLIIGAVLERENPRDWLLFSKSFEARALSVPEQALVGTSSVRRKAQLLHLRPRLQIKGLRGNVDTRLRQLENGRWDAIVLAAAGLRRLNVQWPLVLELETLPAPGQGIIAIQCREQDSRIRNLLSKIHHEPTAWAWAAERAVVERLGADCHVPLAAYAHFLPDQKLVLRAEVWAADGAYCIETTREAFVDHLDHATRLGYGVGSHLLQQGAASLLKGGPLV